MSEDNENPPAVQATSAVVKSPINGAVLPVETRFVAGRSGNPAGSRNAGSTWKEWTNRMSHWPTAQIEAVANDPDAPAAQIASAKELLRWISDERTRAGHPVAGESADRVLSYTIGKPQQAISIQQTSCVESVIHVERLSVETIRALCDALAEPDHLQAGADVAPVPTQTPEQRPAEESKSA